MKTAFQDGELELLREFVLLPIALSIFERDKSVIEDSELKMKLPYVAAINTAMDRITRQLGKMKREMHQKGLKVARQNRSEIGIDCIFLCLGYSQQFRMQWDLVKAETQIRMQQYLNGTNDHS
ncbi:hypothetical protein [Brevibacillus sp. NRS-1366]|uniref:hypothetical protein n=1 Tax=Brevibacillus sp. NRS-1366 TaxID=3233899 RepID=UPI003D204487